MSVTTVFIECVSCGCELVLGTGPMDDASASVIARKRGWTVKGFRGAKRTRCKRCRRAGRRDTRAADAGRIGNRAGWLTTGRTRL